jgi:hypothetical protein
MRLVRTFEGAVADAPEAVFAKLASGTKGDGVAIVKDDAATRELWVEGAWWFHGKWSVTADPAGGSRVRLQVWSKATGVRRVAASLPVWQALRKVKAGWDDDLASLASRRPGV